MAEPITIADSARNQTADFAQIVGGCLTSAILLGQFVEIAVILSEDDMAQWDHTTYEDEYSKWSKWTKKPKKPPQSLARYASALVLAMSAVVLSGAHLNIAL